MIKIKNKLLILLLFYSTGINAATLFVESLDDTVGTAATLRQTIFDASSGDTIQFNVSGTILLDEALGELVVDKQLIIDGQNKIIIDGQDQINIGFHITNAGTADASSSVIQNITIQNFNGELAGSGTAPLELPARGILIDGGAQNCSVLNTTVKDVNAGSQDSSGIFSNELMAAVKNNVINNISSLDSDSSGITINFSGSGMNGDCLNNHISNVLSLSGSTFGIFINTIDGNCSDNVINNISSSNSDSFGISIGFFSGGMNGDCSNNQVSNVLSSSDFSVGIFIQDINGNCSDNKTSNILSDSDFAAGIVINDINGDCSDNRISVISSSDQSYGILMGLAGGSINGECSNNQINNVSSSNQSFGIAVRFSGGSIGGDCSNNQINSVSSSLISYGIITTGNLDGDCSNNQISNLSSSISYGISIVNAIIGNCINNRVNTISSNRAYGIEINNIDGNCSNNQIHNLSSSDESVGITIDNIDADNMILCNNIRNINSDDEACGLRVLNGNALTFGNNTINSIVSINGLAQGLILGNNADTGQVVINSYVSSNSISNITGDNSNGFGITILSSQDQSVGNDLLKNSIFDINGKAINIIDNGVPVDAVITLQSAVCGANKVFIRGTLEPEVDLEKSEFLVQFFSSNNNTPPQAMTFIGETTIQADDTTPFMTEIKTCNVDTSGFITATATALPEGSTENNNTSEVSNAISGCDSSTVCSLFCTPVPTPPACPLLRQGFGGQTIS